MAVTFFEQDKVTALEKLGTPKYSKDNKWILIWLNITEYLILFHYTL